MAEGPPDQTLVIHTQYIKDLSFENPNAPGIFTNQNNQQPALNISLDVRSTKLSDRTFEVVLTLRAQATTAETTAFLAELDYAGVVSVAASVAEADVEPLLKVEAPRFLFPFARNMLAVVTREGGFPPLFVNPIDFESIHARRKQSSESSVTAPA
ncbi:MAG TPA: protein-export chaperone SecB [Kiloniellales bacterium]